MTDRGARRPTLKTISDLSGLAVATVSRALHDAPDIGEATKRRVREIAEDIGYVPNRAGVRLRTGKTNVIAVVLSTDHDVTDHTGRLISSIARALHDTRYHMIVTPYFPQEDPMKPIRYIVETRSADAVIMNQIEPEDPRVAYLMQKQMPFAAYGRTSWADRHPYFDFDNASFGRTAGETLVGDGRRNFLLVAPPMKQAYAIHMSDGLRSVLSPLGFPLTVLEGATSDDTSEVIRLAVRDHLLAHPETDAVVCASTAATIAAVTGAEWAGRTIGRDISVFAKEAIPLLGFFRADIRTVSEDVSQAGAFLARAAIQAIEEPDLPPLQELRPGTLSERYGDNPTRRD